MRCLTVPPIRVRWWTTPTFSCRNCCPRFAAARQGWQLPADGRSCGSLLTNLLPVAAGVTIFGGHLPGGGPGVLRGLGFAAAVLGPPCSAADRRRLLLSRTGRRDSDRHRLTVQAG
jgi:hypothetical protein